MARKRSRRTSRDPGMPPAARAWAMAWVFGIVGLAWATLTWSVPRVEQRILDGVRATVAPIVRSPVAVSIEGRRASVRGDVADEAERETLIAAIAASPGVHEVVDESRIAVVPVAPDVAPADTDVGIDADTGTDADASADASADADMDRDTVAMRAESPSTGKPSAVIAEELRQQVPDAPPSLSLRLENGALSLSGRMDSDEEVDRIVRPVLDSLRPEYLMNSIRSDPAVAEAAWLTSFVALLPALAELDSPSVEIGDRQVTIGGIAPSRGAFDDIVARALDALEGFSLVTRIRVAGTRAAAEASPDRDLTEPSQRTDPSRRTEPDRRTEPVQDIASPKGIESSSEVEPSPEAESLPEAEPAFEDEPSPETDAAALREVFEALPDRRILFRSGSDRFAGASARRIDAIAGILERFPEVPVSIEGHTDRTGTWRMNVEIARRRANAVRERLVAAGISRTRLTAFGFGEGKPIADNATAEGRAANRRIEFRFQ